MEGECIEVSEIPIGSEYYVNVPHICRLGLVKQSSWWALNQCSKEYMTPDLDTNI